MAFAPLRQVFSQNIFRNACYNTFNRPLAYKSAVSLETLYPNSSLKLTTPAFSADLKEKFSGYIPIDKLEVTYSASSGPGGQNVNKVHTKVDVRFKPNEAKWLDSDIKSKLIERYSKQLTKEGYLIVRSDVTRSQQLNLADCMQKLRSMIRIAATAPSQPSQETQERIRQRQLKASRLRVAIKRDDAMKRAQRQPPALHDL